MCENTYEKYVMEHQKTLDRLYKETPDLISRQDAINAMMQLQKEDEELFGVSIPEGFDGDKAVEVLEALPTAQSGRRKGKWINVGEKQGKWMWRCSECNIEEAVPTTTSLVSEISYPLWDFCPNCGVYMRRDELL